MTMLIIYSEIIEIESLRRSTRLPKTLSFEDDYHHQLASSTQKG